MDNLESQTYEIFERDPIKYKQYQRVRNSFFILNPPGLVLSIKILFWSVCISFGIESPLLVSVVIPETCFPDLYQCFKENSLIGSGKNKTFGIIIV